jgi:hypothetical protein
MKLAEPVVVDNEELRAASRLRQVGLDDRQTCEKTEKEEVSHAIFRASVWLEPFWVS